MSTSPAAPSPTGIAIVPAPQRLTSRGPVPFRLPAVRTLTLAVPEALGGAPTEWFATWAERLHGVEVQTTSSTGAGPGAETGTATGADAGATTGPAVQVVLGDAGPLGLDIVETASGVDPRPVPADERHRLTVDESGVLIEAVSADGAFRALTTLLQLLTDEDGGVHVPAVVVEDGPAYPWRGLSLDVVRHEVTKDDVLRVVDLLAWLKLDVLHLHLTDTQAWRLEVPGRPALTGDGPGATPHHFSRADLAEVIAYAADRCVVVVPEVDLPGHVAAAVGAYPELQGERHTVHPLAVYLDPDVPAAVEFMRDVIASVVELAPGPFVHLGADEPFGMPADAYVRFVRAAHDELTSHGKRAVAWQESARAGCLGPEDVLQYWIGPDNVFDVDDIKTKAPVELHPLVDDAASTFALAPGDVPAAVGRGVPVLVSTNTTLYLDRPYADPAHDAEGEARRGRVGFPGYEARSLEQTFGWHPTTLPELAGAQVAGVEAAVWCETVESFDDLAFLLLPRLAGAAEKAWSTQVTTWADHATRIAAHRQAWCALGFGGAYRPAHAG